MSNLQKIVKVTQTQYDTLAAGGTVGSYTGLNDNYLYLVPTNTPPNYYHSTGTWNGLTYTAASNGGAPTLAFTIPTGTDANTVAVGNHTHGYYTKPTGGIPSSDLAESYYLASNPSGFTSNEGTVKSVRVQAGTGLSSSTSTAQSTTLNTTISIASGYKLPTTTEWNSKANTSALNNYLERESQDEYGVGFSQNYFYIDLVDQDGNASMAYRFGNSETIGFNITNEDEGGEVFFGTQGFEFITPTHASTSISYSNIATKTELTSSLGATHWDGAILNLFSDGSGNVVSFYGSLHYLKADRTLSVKGVIRVRAQGSNASSVQEIPITPIYNKLGLSASNVDSTQGLHWIGTGIPWNGTDIVSSVMGAGEIIFLAQGLQTFAIGYISNVNSGALSLLPISSIATASHMVDFMIHFTA